MHQEAVEQQHGEGGIGAKQPGRRQIHAIGSGERRADGAGQYPADAAGDGKRPRGAEDSMDGFGVSRARDPVGKNAQAGGKGEGKYEKKNVKKQKKFRHAIAPILPGTWILRSSYSLTFGAMAKKRPGRWGADRALS